MTTAECWAAITTLLNEFTSRVKNREDVEFFHKLESRYQEARECQRKEIADLHAKHAREKAEICERHAQAIGKKDAKIAGFAALGQKRGKGPHSVITGTHENPKTRYRHE